MGWLRLYLLTVRASLGRASHASSPDRHLRPEPGAASPLRALVQGQAFEAKVSAVTLKLTSADGADPVVGEWTFLASNSDGQLHKVEIYTRLLDESGTQIAIDSKECMLGGGSHDFACTVPLNVKAAEWQAIKSLRIVTDWLS